MPKDLCNPKKGSVLNAVALLLWQSSFLYLLRSPSLKIPLLNATLKISILLPFITIVDYSQKSTSCTVRHQRSKHTPNTLQPPPHVLQNLTARPPGFEFANKFLHLMLHLCVSLDHVFL